MEKEKILDQGPHNSVEQWTIYLYLSIKLLLLIVQSRQICAYLTTTTMEGTSGTLGI